MFQPAAGDTLEINGSKYQVAAHPSAPTVPYGQEGRQAVVYKLSSESGDWALKVFKPKYRRPYLVRVARRIREYSQIPGMEVCDRAVVSTDKNMDLLKSYPELVYAALMPWIEGPTWMETMLSRTIREPAACLALARQLLKTLVALEEDGLSHGDLSGANTMLPSSNGLGIALVDVEQLYAPGMEPPETLTESSPGYGFPNQGKPYWGPYSDRFPGSIMLAEMLAFCDQRIVDQSSGESFFSEEELGNDTPRYRLMVEVLEEKWGEGVASPFKSNWCAEIPEDCAPFAEWLIGLPDKLRQKKEDPTAPRPLIVPKAVQSSHAGPDEHLESLIAKADRLRAQRDFRGSLELYALVSQTEGLPDYLRSDVDSRISQLKEDIARDNYEKAHPASPQTPATIPSTGRMRNYKKVLIPAAILVVVILTLGLVLAFASSGPTLKVPNVVAMSEKEAQRALAKLGLKYSSKQKEDNGTEPGKVLAQDPTVNLKVKKGETVVLTVAVRGKVKVPNVVGVGQDQALAMIKQASLNVALYQVGTGNQAQHGIIVSQDPPADTALDHGASVTLKVGVYQPPAAQQQTTQNTSQQQSSTNHSSSTNVTPVSPAPTTPATPTHQNVSPPNNG